MMIRNQSVNELRWRMFTKKNSSRDRLPTTLDALVIHLCKTLNRTPTFQKNFVICFIEESPLKMTKNAFYFTLKAYFVLKIFKFL